jgi:hypothetical protein
VTINTDTAHTPNSMVYNPRPHATMIDNEQFQPFKNTQLQPPQQRLQSNQNNMNTDTVFSPNATLLHEHESSRNAGCCCTTAHHASYMCRAIDTDCLRPCRRLMSDCVTPAIVSSSSLVATVLHNTVAGVGEFVASFIDSLCGKRTRDTNTPTQTQK